jgi:hypothetical protein
MGKLKPIGSEKLQGMDKLSRILEITRYKETLPNAINESSSNEYNITLPDGNTYHIDKEKSGYVIKRTLSEGTTEYVEPMKNRKYYSSYSQAFKRLNLITKEINSLTGNQENISLFTEQKKFVLKTPKPETPAPAPAAPAEPEMPAPSPEPMGAPSPEAGGGEMPMDEPPVDDMGGEEEMPMDEPTDDMGDMGAGEPEDDDVVTFKSIQKLTGKLGQKLRKINQGEEPISPDDTKYVINSILSALDLSVLSDEDMEEIIGRLEDSEFEGEGEMEGEPDMGDDELDAEIDAEIEEPSPEEEPIPEGEMTEEETNEYIQGMMAGEYDLGFSEEPKEMNYSNLVKNAFTGTMRDKMGEMTEDDEMEGVHNILDSVFSESKVDSIIKSYFVESDTEKKFLQEQKQRKFLTEKTKKIKTMREVKNLSESFQQEKTADKFLTRYNKAKFIGKTNKNNLVFEVNGKQYKITPDGAIL